MKIEIRLKKILHRYHLDRRGIVKAMAADLKCHRHTVRKLLCNELKNPPLDLLGAVCQWLVNNGVPSDILPQAILGPSPSDLWKAAAKLEAVAIYVGAYSAPGPTGQTSRWIAQSDAAALAKVVQCLSEPALEEGHRPAIVIQHVPFRMALASVKVASADLKVAQKRAMDTYRRMQEGCENRTAVIIGSQRVNNQAEMAVSDMFGCDPFKPATGTKRRVPFHLAYRKADRGIRSCFGGNRPPPGSKGPVVPGLHFLGKNRKWIACPWNEASDDAGVVLLVRDPGIDTLQIVAMGYSGRATEAIGEELLVRPNQFWPPTAQIRGKEVGAFICRFEFSGNAAGGMGEPPHAKAVEVIPIDTETLEKYVA